MKKKWFTKEKITIPEYKPAPIIEPKDYFIESIIKLNESFEKLKNVEFYPYDSYDKIIDFLIERERIITTSQDTRR